MGRRGPPAAQAAGYLRCKPVGNGLGLLWTFSRLFVFKAFSTPPALPTSKTLNTRHWKKVHNTLQASRRLELVRYQR